MMVTTTATITIANSSMQNITLPLHGVLDISSTEVTVLDAIAPGAGNSYDKYYVDLSTKLPGGRLVPGVSVSFTVRLVCMSTVRYSYKVLAFGTIQAGNQAPTANAGSSRTVTLPYVQSYVNVTLDGSGSNDPDGTISTYAWSGTPQPSSQMKPIVSLAEGHYIFTLTVTDNQNASSPPASVTITVVKEVVRLPEINVTTAPPYKATIGAASPLNISVTAESPDGRPVILSATPFVTNAVFNARPGLQATGTFSLKPDYGQQGNYLVTFSARDSYGLSAAKTVQIGVDRTNRPPLLTVPATAFVDEGGVLVLPFSAQDPDGDILTLTAVGLPAKNAVFVPSAGSITFSPDFNQSGTYLFTISAYDGQVTVKKSVDVTVNEVTAGPSRNWS